MPGQRGTEVRRMAGAVLVRLPSETVDRVRAAAAASGLSDAAYVRARLVAVLNADPLDAVPTRRIRAPRPSWLSDLDKARETAAELTGVMVAAAQVRRLAGARDAIELETVIPATRKAARNLASMIRRVCDDLDHQLRRSDG